MRERTILPFLLLLSMATRADAASVALGTATVDYDPAIWRAAGTIFTCIAPDCDGEPEVFAWSHPAGDAGTACTKLLSYRDPVPIAVEARPGQVVFSAWSSWSGCRARDNPVLTACGVAKGTVYRFTNVLGEGCNHAPELSESHFAELLRGVKLDGAAGP
jgi:hypothetical protein